MRSEGFAMHFDTLASRHKDAVYRQLFRMCGNHDDAEDVLVEALLKAHRALPSLQDEAAFQAWLTQIGRRACGRLRRREKLSAFLTLEAAEHVPDPASGSPEGAAIEQELKDCLLRAFETLPPEYREVYRLRDIEQWSAAEAAERLGIGVAALKSRLHRARKMIRERLDCALLES